MKDDRIPLADLLGPIAITASRKKLADFFGLSVPTITNWQHSGVPKFQLKRTNFQNVVLPPDPEIPTRHQKMPSPRAEKMKYDFTHGKSMSEISKEHGLSRERVRQILKKYGMTRHDGGKSVMTLIAKAHHPKPPDRFMPIYGCTKEEAILANKGAPLAERGTAAQRYVQQRRNAIFSRHIGWELTLLQWVNIWAESGHWKERGRGKGYCMTRIGDTGPYSVDNVEIKTVGENFSESFYKHPQAERRQKALDNRARRINSFCNFQ